MRIIFAMPLHCQNIKGMSMKMPRMTYVICESLVDQKYFDDVTLIDLFYKQRHSYYHWHLFFTVYSEFISYLYTKEKNYLYPMNAFAPIFSAIFISLLKIFFVTERRLVRWLRQQRWSGKLLKSLDIIIIRCSFNYISKRLFIMILISRYYYLQRYVVNLCWYKFIPRVWKIERIKIWVMIMQIVSFVEIIS